MNNNKIILSVIIPVYNTEKYLDRCFDSVIKATMQLNYETEVIIINDGSTDNSEDIIKQYCEKYSHLFQVNKLNGGLSEVKNLGLKLAKGQYVTFVDSDDYICNDMYLKMVAVAIQKDADIVVCDIERVYEKEIMNKVFSCTDIYSKEAFEQIINTPMMPASWNKIVRRELYDEIEFPVGKVNEDVAVTPIILARAKRIEVIHQALYKYYQREGSIQNSKFNESKFDILDSSKMCIDRTIELDRHKAEKIKKSIYVNQVLSLPINRIRHESFWTRYYLLRRCMKKAEQLFPDIWDDTEIIMPCSNKTFLVRKAWKIAVILLKNKWYLPLCMIWTVGNILEKLLKSITKL